MSDYQNMIRQVDKLISKHEEQIDHLRELKRSLIHQEQKSNHYAVGVSLTPIELVEFKTLYEISVADNKHSFVFNRVEFLTGFAKYVIEYMEQKV